MVAVGLPAIMGASAHFSEVFKNTLELLSTGVENAADQPDLLTSSTRMWRREQQCA